MYAVIKTGGKQYRVAVGDRLRVEAIAAELGTTVRLEQVLLISDGGRVDTDGAALAKVAVEAKVLGHGLRSKIHVFKMHRRKGYRRSQGHRQQFTELQIEEIRHGGAVAKKPATATPAPAKTEPKPQVAAKPEVAAKPKSTAKPKAPAKPAMTKKVAATKSKAKTVTKAKTKTTKAKAKTTKTKAK